MEMKVFTSCTPIAFVFSILNLKRKEEELKMFLKIIISLLTIFSYFANADQFSSASKVQYIKENLQLYRDNLLNETLLTFLNECYSPECCEDNEKVLCPSYFELVRLLNISHVNINLTNYQLKEFEQSIGEPPISIAKFCENFSNCIPENSFYKSQISQDEVIKFINDSRTCKLICTDVQLTKIALRYTVKPLCKFISWMSGKLFSIKKPETINKTTNTVTTNANKNEELRMVGKLSLIKNPETINKATNTVITNANKNEELLSSSTEIIKIAPNTKDNINPLLKGVKAISLEKATNNASTKTNIDSVPEKAINSNASTISGILASIQDAVKPENKFKTNLSLENGINNSKNFDEITKLNPENIKISTEEQKQKQEEEELISNDLDGSQGDEVDSLKNKQKFSPDINAYSDDDEDDEGTTNDIFKSNLSFKDSEPENIKQRLHQTLYERNESNLISSDPFYEESGSNFFIYFLIAMFVCIMAYVLYHNKSKIFALVIEGRRSQKGKNRRKHLAGYRKLDTNLEEAITSNSSGQVTQIIY